MSKEVKAALKEIREAIKNKDNTAAIKKCEELLKNDPKNYMGLVLMGAAYQESDKKTAAKYLKQAVECVKDTDALLALQGLANCADAEDLPNIYQKLIRLVPTKYEDYHEKLVALSNQNNFNECCNVFQQELQNDSEISVKQKDSAFRSLGKIIAKVEKIPENFDPNLIILALENVLNAECGSIIELSCCKVYFKMLYNKSNNFDKLLKKAEEIVKKYPNELFPLEWICLIYKTQHQKNNIDELLEQPIDHYINKLLTINQNSILAITVKAQLYYKNHQYVEAKNLLVQIVDHDPRLIKELLADIYMKIGVYCLAENILSQLNLKNLKYGICLCNSDDLDSVNEGILLLEDKTQFNRNDELLYALGKAYFKTKNEIKLQNIFEEIKQLENEELLKIFEFDFCTTTEKKLDILNMKTDSSFEIDLRKGKLYIELKQYKDALPFLLKATKMKPYFADCYLYLGILYNSIKDVMHAKKCFRKCSDLNPCCELAISNLSAIYRSEGEWELNANFLDSVVKQLDGTKLKWVLFQQSLNYLDMEQYEKAIQSLRVAMKYDQTNILYWEILAEVYHERGSYNSAMKVFQKILEQNPDHKYAKLQVATIKCTMGLYNESIEDFSELLLVDDQYLPAIKGIAEAHYQLANHLLHENLFGRCKSNLQIAIDHLQKIFLNHKNKNFLWLWRLTANIFTAVACLPSKLSFLKIYGILARREEEDVCELNRKDLFELALKFYSGALKLTQDDTFLWQDLSLCAYFYILFEENSDKPKLMQLAQNACKSSIKCSPKRWQTWNLLGVLCATKLDDLEPNYSLAQHYFIKGLQLDENCAIIWANLGVLLLNVNDISLSNKYFKRSQESNPIYINGWLGQAIIAELIGEEEEAIDLFRHCTELDFHIESALGYSHWICKILSKQKCLSKSLYDLFINKLHAISHAMDCISWYTRLLDDKSSIESLSYYGYLFSNQKLWSSAIKAYELAVEKAEGEQKDIILFNLGYCYLNSGKTKLAASCFSSLSEASVKSTIGYALSLFQSEDALKSYEVYQCALEWLASKDEEKAQILISMSAIVYSLQGEKDAKSILYQCLDLEPRPIKAMFSACALGIIHGDLQFAESIINELKKFENDMEYCHHIAFLTSQYYYAKRQSKQAYYYLISKVHTYPDRPLLRKVLADFAINYLSKTKKYSKGTCQIAQSVVILGHKASERNDSLETAKALLTASEAMKNVDKIRQKKLIQQSIHMHPSFKLAWNALVSVKA
ncbi:tetratricopeptide repeat protein 37 [Condylostylus longicornis]|uniref:tetratricopeptide repeat protein 37 n=1 Tax=Condylostylus longicornis TaxID=2530218 RepID=UPI00244DD877|nr:tetratricopeptide repeat protein 37 [Condylostylus longicornis]